MLLHEPNTALSYSVPLSLPVHGSSYVKKKKKKKIYCVSTVA